MTIVDVRSPEEYLSGHIDHSINIPLNEIPHKLKDIQSFTPPILLCCASGNRSGQAEAYLKQNGIDCENGGSWKQVAARIKS